ncbi:MAG: hypothetical protein PHG89_10625, partial [Gallionella sp.]|nr:hypothetical protein [Gallionella sp.]
DGLMKTPTTTRRAAMNKQINSSTDTNNTVGAAHTRSLNVPMILEANQIQIVCTGNEYEEADRSNSEAPEWPVQDEGAHWHHEQFNGQRVAYRTSHVHFGFMAEEIAEEDVPRDADGEMNFNDLFLCNNGRVYRAV